MPITFTLEIDAYNERLTSKENWHYVWKFEDDKWNQYQELLKVKLQEWRDATPDFYPCDPNMLETAVQQWTNCIIETGYLIFGKKKTFKDAKPWWSNQLNEMRKLSQKLRNQFRKRRTQESYETWKEKDKEWRRMLKSAKHESLVKFYDSINKGNNKLLFSSYRNYSVNKIVSIPTLQSTNVNGDVISAQTTKEKVDMLVSHFAKPPFSPDQSSISKQVEIENYLETIANGTKQIELIENLEDINQDITTQEIMEAIKELHLFKAQGPDDIHNQMIKHGGMAMVESLQLLFNWSYRIGYFPVKWKQFFIAPIPKPDKDQNHRPISLISCVAKVMERIITKRIMYYLHQNNLISKYQCGFQNNHSTYDLLLYMTEQIYQAIHQNSVIYAAFLDISSAYDSVWRDGLRYKLRTQFHLNGRMY